MTPQRRDDQELEKRLLRYSTAAGLTLAAGLALPAQPAHAAKVYVDVVPDQTVSFGTFDLDFDQDGNPEFRLLHTSFLGTAYIYISSRAGGGDQGLSVMTSGGDAAALGGSATVSGTWSWSAAPATLATHDTGSTVFGNWAGVGSRYLGLKFNLDGAGPCYGWAYLEVPADVSSFTVYMYGYEDAGGSMHCGTDPTAVSLSEQQAASASALRLSLLGGALGASVLGLSAWLRRRLSHRTNDMRGTG